MAGDSYAGITVPEGSAGGVESLGTTFDGMAGTLSGTAARLRGMPGGLTGLDRPASVTPLGFLPGLLGDLIDLGPRPRPDGAELRVSASTLAVALACEGPEREQLAGVLRKPFALTRIEAEPADGSPGVSLELLDTAAGHWLVRADGSDAVLSPTTATRVFRGLVRLALA